MSSLVSNIATLLGLALVGGLGYYLFVLQDSSEISSTGTDISAVRVANEEFVRELNQIKTVQLSDSIFADARFRSLVDYTLPVPPQSLGRTNPFAPVE